MSRCSSCWHSWDAHEHYTPTTQCGLCMCPMFARPFWRVVLDALLGRGRGRS